MPDGDLLELTDPRAMRALAHPLRLRMLRMLQQDGPATATTLAAACEESSGSTSFHLRQLAKYGFIDELTDRGAGRERWWRASSRGFRFDGPAAEPAALLLRSRVLDQNVEALARYLDAEPDVGPAWGNAALFANTTAHLTVDEMNALNVRLVEMLRVYERPDVAQRPADARRVQYIVYGLPE